MTVYILMQIDINKTFYKFLSPGFSWCHALHSLENNCAVVHTLSKYTEIPNVFSATLTG